MWFWYLIYFVGSLVSYGILRTRRDRRLEDQKGCQPPNKYPHWEPFFGLDLFVETGKLLTENRILPAIIKRYERLGNTFQVQLPGTKVICSIEPENIQNVFATNAANWGTSWRQNGMLEYCGRGFLVTDGEEWQAFRAMINPSFNKANTWDHHTYEHYLSLMMRQIPRDGSTVDLQELINMLYLDTATLFLFGESFGSLSSESSKEAQLFLESAEYSIQTGGFRIALGPLRFLHYNRKFQQSNQVVQNTMDSFVDRAFERKRVAENKPQAAGQKSLLMVDAMVLATEDRIAIRNNVLQGFIAAHETTGHLISNICWLLAHHPTTWVKLRTEILQTIGDESPLNFDDAQKVPYLRSIINEALRLYPIFPLHQRIAFTDTTLPTGGGPSGKSPIYVPAGTRFEATFHALHRRKDVFGSDAESYRPERWDSIAPRPWEFMPFGGGPKSCVGRQKALAETSYFLCRLARDFEKIESRDDREWTGSVTVTSKNANGCLVGLYPSGTEFVNV